MRLPAAAAAAALFAGLVAVGGPAAAAHGDHVHASSTALCPATLVHYQSYAGVEKGLAPIPWIAASPLSTGLVGHLFYYDGLNVWKQTRVRPFHIYTNGESPDGRVSTKILWELRHGGGPELRVQGRRLDGSGSFIQQLQGGGVQFPSIITVPKPGCWRLTLTTGKLTGRVTVIAVPGKKS